MLSDMTARDAAERILGKGVVASKEISESNSNNASALQITKMNESRQSGVTASTARRQRQEEEAAKHAARAEKGKRPKAGGYNNVKNLIDQAWRDSDRFKPILMMIDSSVNVAELVQGFFMEKAQQLHLNNNFRSELLSKGGEEETKSNIERAAQAGDWYLLENVHLVPDWLPELMNSIAVLEKNEQAVGRHFRLWLSSAPMENCPTTLLERSIKVALQPPTTIKQRIERMVLDVEDGKLFNKSKC